MKKMFLVRVIIIIRQNILKCNILIYSIHYEEKGLTLNAIRERRRRMKRALRILWRKHFVPF